MKTKKDLITICIPTYNAEATIYETLESIKKQTHINVKIKIFDNQSTDKTVQIIQKFNDSSFPIELSINETNLGGEGNFTKCIENADGDYTALFHSDDLYNSDILSNAMEIFNENKSVLAIFFHSDLIDSNGNRIGSRFLPSELSKKAKNLLCYEMFIKLIYKYGNFVTCPGVIVRTEIYKKNIRFWNGLKYATSADLDVWLRLTKLGPVIFYSKPSLLYRKSESSYSYRLIQKRTHRHDLFLVLDDYLNDPSLNEDIKRKLIFYYKFLVFKDEALRAYNLLRNKKDIKTPKYSLSLIQTFKYVFQSKFHLKYFILGNSIRIISYILEKYFIIIKYR
ncbi:MAG: glycosyltransferase [Bdellovibrionaceae bacterium]|nr:glycosyltransferase [Pseudobdellovibrionaceae bacterium]